MQWPQITVLICMGASITDGIVRCDQKRFWYAALSVGIWMFLLLEGGFFGPGKI